MEFLIAGKSVWAEIMHNEWFNIEQNMFTECECVKLRPHNDSHHNQVQAQYSPNTVEIICGFLYYYHQNRS